MSIFISLGIYSQKGADGIINGDSDRKAAMEKMVSSVGGKLIDYHITRGQYDFVMIAEAESFVHGISVEKVHYHEIGCIDSLVDIIGVCAAVEYLKPASIFCEYPPAGNGFVDTSHGRMPIPVPAVIELAKRHNITLTSHNDDQGELTTPTGLALLISLVDSFKRPVFFNINSIGIGLGHKEFRRPNLLRILLLDDDTLTLKSS